ncbi:SGNH/GDSL hydrolase family protein [Candidatus Uabimicrobium amorphum]|uniref:AlgX/AlgJ SGNH hydrolase-like domain-containing protein n=1 Tax=Uabimicrobium amorphum TaxID=2596890 RepID=A0A5S9IPS0_UABAM|nr:SGNH/GDSL hydrolase family protein [Candidatus Uabimicrobium amorphum]BBM85644.1 hypothetical protein UABAM_04018 [Candidatus Uabimicrobium amorphum]
MKKLPLKKKILFTFFVVLFTFVCLEIVARIAESFISSEATQQISIMKENPNNTGSYRVKENLHIVYNNRFTIKTNSHGMAWFEVKKTKRQGVKRIAFLGDSFTFGQWADNFERSFVGIFAKGISQFKSYEALNFGVGGYGFPDMFLLLQEKVMLFSPDYVVICTFNGNDFRDTYLGLNKYNIINGSCHWDEKNTAKKLGYTYRAKRKRFRKNFALYRLHRLYKKRRSRLESQSIFFDTLKVGRKFTYQSFWSQKPYSQIANKAKEESLSYLLKIYQFLQKRNIELLIVSIPFERQIYTKKLVGPDYDLSYPQKFIEKWSQPRSIKYLDLMPAIREIAWKEKKRLYLSGDNHFNNLGHEAAGKKIAEWFIKEVVQK